ncbi:hypothetical protein AGMMS50267_07560 [Spirochaetia bacterium]|nr:hypothetical protein AGMMS50267_07560 [Spirochaetia bacterium]
MNTIMRYIAGPVLLLLLTATAAADEFAYKHAAGDKYRILSSVQEDVYLNRVFSHR